VLDKWCPLKKGGGTNARTAGLPSSQFLPLRVGIGDVREGRVPTGKLLSGPIATLLRQDTSIVPLGTITHITGMF